MKAISNIGLLFGLQWKYNKKYFLVTVIALLLPSMGNLVQVILPKWIIQYIQTSNEYTL